MMCEIMEVIMKGENRQQIEGLREKCCHMVSSVFSPYNIG
jgi:hypothetical protein